MTLADEYFEYVKKYTKSHGPKTIVLIQVGSFFEVYSLKKHGKFINNKIEEFSRVCDMTIANKGSKYKIDYLVSHFSPCVYYFKQKLLLI